MANLPRARGGLGNLNDPSQLNQDRMGALWERYRQLHQWDIIQAREERAQRLHTFPGVHIPERPPFLDPMEDAFLRAMEAAPDPIVSGTRDAPIDFVDTPDEPPGLDSDTYSVDVCYSKALDIFPKISRDYVERLCKHYQGPDRYRQNDLGYVDQVINEILGSPSYPKEKQERKRMWEDDEDDEEEWPTHHGDHMYIESGIDMLIQVFRGHPISVVRNKMNECGQIYATYLYMTTIDKPMHDNNLPRRSRLRPGLPVIIYDHELRITDEMRREMEAARRQSKKDPRTLRKQTRAADAERLNIEEHTRAGNLVECQCCYSDVPINRSVPCQGANAHLFCFKCVRQAAKSQVELMKYQLHCFDTSGCQAEFSRSDLKPAVGSSLMARLDKLQQQDEITRAGIDGLAECPFCDYKAIYPPIEEDREFVCLNPKCEKTSCRLCNAESHTPKTCEEAKKDRGVSERHQVEEAMSEAFIRNCPRCQLAMAKDMGCNKMTCPRCHCVSCYTCKKDITREGYHHFRRGPGGCMMDEEGGRALIREQVAVAEKAAIEQVRAENPDLTWEELRITNPEHNRDTPDLHLNRAHFVPLPQPAHRRAHQLGMQAYRPPPFQQRDYNFPGPAPDARHQFRPELPPWPFHPEPPPPRRGVILNNLINHRANLERIMNMAPGDRAFAGQPNRNDAAQAPQDPRTAYPGFFPFYGV